MDVHIQLDPNPIELSAKIQLDLDQVQSIPGSSAVCHIQHVEHGTSRRRSIGCLAREVSAAAR
jgi:hypothetical protein